VGWIFLDLNSGQWLPFLDTAV